MVAIGYNPVTKTLDLLYTCDFYDTVGRIERNGQSKRPHYNKMRSHRKNDQYDFNPSCKIYWPWERNA